MRIRPQLVRSVLLAAAIAGAAAPALAQQTAPRAEVGASLASVTVVLPKFGSSGTLFGIPSGSLGLFTPSVYLSIFASSHVAVEPQVGLLVASGGGSTDYLLNFSAHIDYVVRGTDVSSPFVFGGAGFVSSTGGGSKPASVTGGAGYRIRAGDRLVFRVDGGFTHFTDRQGSAVAVTLSMGGLFGRH
jgi:hypothetical protein